MNSTYLWSPVFDPDSLARSFFGVEDDGLGQAEQQRDDPRKRQHDVGLVKRPLVVDEGKADGLGESRAFSREEQTDAAG